MKRSSTLTTSLYFFQNNKTKGGVVRRMHHGKFFYAKCRHGEVYKLREASEMTQRCIASKASVDEQHWPFRIWFEKEQRLHPQSLDRATNTFASNNLTILSFTNPSR
jgi:hypothetical protein